jgi:hypothetical protein
MNRDAVAAAMMVQVLLIFVLPRSQDKPRTEE